MRIMEEQEKTLNSFKCERLSSNAINGKLIQSFLSKRGSSLVSYFKQFGLKEDIDGSTTYYFIKTKDDEVLMFFSLKCGTLFEPLQDEDKIKLAERIYKYFDEINQVKIPYHWSYNLDDIDMGKEDISQIVYEVVNHKAARQENRDKRAPKPRTRKS